jgi:hypothetical protein
VSPFGNCILAIQERTRHAKIDSPAEIFQSDLKLLLSSPVQIPQPPAVLLDGDFTAGVPLAQDLFVSRGSAPMTGGNGY